MKNTPKYFLLRASALLLGYAALNSPATPSETAAVSLLAAGQTQKELSASINAYYQLYGKPTVYLMLDKPLYQPGQSIWFRVDLRKSATLLPVSEAIGTVELLDPKGSSQGKKRLLLKEGVGANDFALSEDAPGGEYTLRFTTDTGASEQRTLLVSSYEAPRLKKNLEFLRKAYGPGAEVSAAINVSRATGEAFAQKPLTAIVTIDEKEVSRTKITIDKEGNALAKFNLPKEMAKGDGLLTILAEDGGVTESIQKRIPILLQNITFEMFPESGVLVDGLPARVYFSALNSIGKPADIEGRVVDSRGKEVSTFRSVRDGLGRFSLTPSSQEEYFIEIT
jgi:alpha-2-macroglobulin-like protein